MYTLRSMKQIKWILIGEVVAAQGNQGEVKIIPHTDFPERFFNMEEVRLFSLNEAEPALVVPIETCRLHKEAVILKLKGIDSISEAESLRKMQVKVHVNELMPLPPNRYYIFQVIGLKCITTDGVELGRITDVLQTGANDVYVVRPNPGITKLQEVLIPAIDDVVLEIDVEKGHILVNLLDGLLD